jgi:hypothetical protein
MASFREHCERILGEDNVEPAPPSKKKKRQISFLEVIEEKARLEEAKARDKRIEAILDGTSEEEDLSLEEEMVLNAKRLARNKKANDRYELSKLIQAQQRDMKRR